VFWGVSTLPAHGVAVRCLARNGRVVLPGLHAIWSAAKKKLYGREAVPPRKVN
jgi:urease accessory protein UreH